MNYYLKGAVIIVMRSDHSNSNDSTEETRKEKKKERKWKVNRK